MSSVPLKSISDPAPEEKSMCVICAEGSSSKIVKDDNFVKMMSLYWEGIEADVKPQKNKEFDLCKNCFDSLVQFYETENICNFFETRLKELRSKILRKNLEGIVKRQNDKIAVLDMHIEIQKKWGTKLEPGSSSALKGYKLTTYVEIENEGNKVDGSTSENLSQPPEKRLRTESSNVSQILVARSSQRVGAPPPLSHTPNVRKTTSRKPRRKKTKRSVWSDDSDSEDSDFCP